MYAWSFFDIIMNESVDNAALWNMIWERMNGVGHDSWYEKDMVNDTMYVDMRHVPVAGMVALPVDWATSMIRLAVQYRCILYVCVYVFV